MYTPNERSWVDPDEYEEDHEVSDTSTFGAASLPPWLDGQYYEEPKLYLSYEELDRRYSYEREWFDGMDLLIARPKAEALVRLLGSNLSLAKKKKAIADWRVWLEGFCAPKTVDGELAFSGIDWSGSHSDIWVHQQPGYRQYQRELLQAQWKRDNATPKRKLAKAKASEKTSARRWLARNTEKLRDNPSPGLLAEAKQRLRILGLSLEGWLRSCRSQK